MIAHPISPFLLRRDTPCRPLRSHTVPALSVSFRHFASSSQHFSIFYHILSGLSRDLGGKSIGISKFFATFVAGRARGARVFIVCAAGRSYCAPSSRAERFVLFTTLLATRQEVSKKRARTFPPGPPRHPTAKKAPSVFLLLQNSSICGAYIPHRRWVS